MQRGLAVVFKLYVGHDGRLAWLSHS